MELRRIYQLAWHQACANWSHEWDFLSNHLDDELAKIREARAWAEMNEIEKLLKAEEEKEE